MGMKIVPPVGEHRMNALGFRAAVGGEGKVGAANGLKTVRRDIGAEELRAADVHPGVQDGFTPAGGHLDWSGCSPCLSAW